MTLRNLLLKGLLAFCSMSTLCFSASFVLPTRSEFSKMSNDERADVITEVWNKRYDIMRELESEDVVNEFFILVHEMLLEDKELCQKEKCCGQGSELY